MNEKRTIPISTVRILRENIRAPGAVFLGFANVIFDYQILFRRCRLFRFSKGMHVHPPSYNSMFPCPYCGELNRLRISFCKFCKEDLPSPEELVGAENGEIVVYRTELCFTLSSAQMERMQSAVITAYDRVVADGMEHASVRFCDDNGEILDVEPVRDLSQFDEYELKKPRKNDQE